MMQRLCLLLSVLLVLFSSVSSLVHHLTIKSDDRHLFKIETFGFLPGGLMQLDVSDFSIKSPRSYTPKKSTKKEKMEEELEDASGMRRLADAPPTTANKVGFLLRHASSESDAEQDLEKIMDHKECIFDHKKPQDIFIDISDPANWKKLSFVHEIHDEDEIGMYTLLFARCNPTGRHYVNFKADVSFMNPGPNYLSAGDSALPTMYFAFFLIHFIAMLVWAWILFYKDPSKRNVVHKPVHNIHAMMLVLLTLKVFSLFFESVRYHYIAIYGVSEMWSIIYYIFATLKGIMLFTVILLIGSGYSLMKNYLNINEKKIVYVVLILQVLNNIAMVVLEETAPGSQGWLTWRDILHLVDILCCLAILLPIVWSMQHLRQAAEADGKAHNNLVKLQLFRRFYIMVIAYIYFTRIAVYLIEATVPFYLMWTGPLAHEVATLVFFVVTGYQFRPAVDNPYLPVSSEDFEGKEYGLDDDAFDANVDLELVRR